MRLADAGRIMRLADAGRIAEDAADAEGCEAHEEGGVDVFGAASVQMPLRTQAPAKATACSVPGPSRRMSRMPAMTAIGSAPCNAGVRATIGQA